MFTSVMCISAPLHLPHTCARLLISFLPQLGRLTHNLLNKHQQKTHVTCGALYNKQSGADAKT